MWLGVSCQSAMAASTFRLCTMVWATLGVCLAASATPHPKSLKNPRFIAVKWGSRVSFSCSSFSGVRWVKEMQQGQERVSLQTSSRVEILHNKTMSTLSITKLQHSDSGVYFCETNHQNKTMQHSCGTELKIMGISTYEQVKDRNTMKDAIILIQSVLLFLFISFPLFMILGKGDSKEAPEDHTYEGLAVETADTYEDIGTYQDKIEKWDLGEHPCEE